MKTKSERSAIVKALWANPEFRAKMMVARNRPEVKTAHRAAIKAAATISRLDLSPEGLLKREHIKAAASAMMKKRWKDPAYRLLCIARSTAGLNRPEVRAKRSEALKLAHARPGVKERYSAGMKRAWADSDKRSRITAALTQALRRPEVRARLSKIQKRLQNTPERLLLSALRTKESWNKAGSERGPK